jgi:hypothetical protein
MRKLASQHLLMGMQNGAATMENSMAFPQKLRNRTIKRSKNCTSEYFSKRFEIRILKRYECSHVHCGISHSSQDVQTTEMSVVEWIKKSCHKHTMWYYPTFKKKEIVQDVTATYNMAEPWRCYARWNKPVTEKYILRDSMKYILRDSMNT